MIQVRGDGLPGGCEGTGEEDLWLSLVVKIPPTHFANGMDKRSKRTQGVQEDSKGFVMDTQKEAVGIA